MKPLFILLFPLVAGHALGQDLALKDSERDPVLGALLDEDDSDGGPSVLVDLTEEEEEEAADNLAAEEESSTDSIELLPYSPTDEPKGINVQVEAGESNASFDTEEIKLVAPFPAKPLSRPPSGWQLIHPANVPPLSENVTLSNGNRIQLEIRPHLLIPEKGRTDIFGITEPGFDPSLHYAQTHTMGAILADSINSLDEQSDRLGAASRRLEELLNSLPAPPPAATPVTEP